MINTTKSDKYDRYLAVVFLAPKGATLSAVSGRLSAQDRGTGELRADRLTLNAPIFLNNALLENGHAVRKDAADIGDDWRFK